MVRLAKLRKERKKLSVAVVIDEKLSPHSLRHEGDWASFVGERVQAVGRAIRARVLWEAKGYGPYRILVGELTEEAKQNSKFSLSRIKQG